MSISYWVAMRQIRLRQQQYEMRPRLSCVQRHELVVFATALYALTAALTATCFSPLGPCELS